jgi:hypothetical protein
MSHLFSSLSSIGQHIRRHPLRFIGSAVAIILMLDVYFNGMKLLRSYDEQQTAFTRNWLACEDKKKDAASDNEITLCQQERVARYEEIRNTPRTARRVYLPEVIGNYIEYYF